MSNECFKFREHKIPLPVEAEKDSILHSQEIPPIHFGKKIMKQQV